MSIDTDYQTLREVLTGAGGSLPQGWAIEFGVYSGYSLNLIAEHMPVIGLDSFEGLPEDWREGFPKGTFWAQDQNLPHTSRAMIWPGLFKDTLPVLQRHGIPQLGLVHIDCDLYSSTVESLEGIKHSIRQGTYVVFDEFHGYEGSEEHERKAWEEFCTRYDIAVSVVATGVQEQAFVIESMPTSLHLQ